MPNQNSHITKNVNLNIKQVEKMLIDGFSVSEISKSLCLPYAAIYNGIRRHNMSHLVSVRKNGKSKTTKQYHARIQKFDYDTLKKEYIDNKLNLYEIADKYGMSASSVFLYMKKLGIDSRSKSEAMTLMYEKRPEIKDVLRQLAFDGVTGIHNKKFNRRETWIEKSFEKFCQENNISYIKQYQINDEGHRYDFLISDKILIELDGVFWHNTDKQKMLDEEYNKLAIQHGYDIIRFTDREIKKTKGKCFDAVRKFI